MSRYSWLSDSKQILHSRDVEFLLEEVDHFHDWFIDEVRGIAGFRFSRGAATYPEGGWRLALRISDGEREVHLYLFNVIEFRLDGRPDALMEGSIQIKQHRNESVIEIRLDSAFIACEEVRWSIGEYKPVTAFGPEIMVPEAPDADWIDEEWVQCPYCANSWQPKWSAEKCNECERVLRTEKKVAPE